MSRRVINTRSHSVATFLTESVQPDENEVSYTAKGGTLTLTPTTTAVPGASVTTAPFAATQFAIITITVEFDIGSGSEDEVTFGIFDAVASNQIDTWHETVGISGGEGTVQVTTTVTTRVAGNGSARTFGLSASEISTGLVAVPAGGCRTVVQVVNG
jgi:hypothetical protein